MVWDKVSGKEKFFSLGEGCMYYISAYITTYYKGIQARVFGDKTAPRSI